MSVESLVISALSREGNLKKAFIAGLDVDSFEICDEEFAWMIRRLEQKLPISPIFFKRKFPEFDLMDSNEASGKIVIRL